MQSLTFEQAQKIARNHGADLRVKNDGTLTLVDCLGEDSGWNDICEVSKAAYSKRDLMHALGY